MFTKILRKILNPFRQKLRPGIKHTYENHSADINTFVRKKGQHKLLVDTILTDLNLNKSPFKETPFKRHGFKFFTNFRQQ
jgi:hypothetical protein